MNALFGHPSGKSSLKMVKLSPGKIGSEGIGSPF
jgi:hypothetical protein